MKGKQRKLYERILRGKSDANMRLDQVRRLLRTLGFKERISSNHHIFTKRGVTELINLQNGGGGVCKPEQVRQLRGIFLRCGHGGV